MMMMMVTMIFLVDFVKILRIKTLMSTFEFELTKKSSHFLGESFGHLGFLLLFDIPLKTCLEVIMVKRVKLYKC